MSDTDYDEGSGHEDLIQEHQDGFGRSSTSVLSGEGMNRSESPGGSVSLQGRKVRKNHNEFERRRRDTQRVRLDELRQAIPGLDPKSSMVAVLTAARVYIEQLRSRNTQLESSCGSARLGIVPDAAAAAAAVMAASNAGRHRPVHPEGPHGLTPNQIQAAALLQFQLQQHQTQQQQAQQRHIQQQYMHLARSLQPKTQPALVRKISSEEEDIEGKGRPFKVGRSKVVDALGTADTLATSTLAPPGFYPNAARPSLLTSVIQESFMTPARSDTRRDSGLLLPTEDPHTFYFGHRDSMQTMMAVPLPMIMDEDSAAYVECLKCRGGVNGLVMIDCDRCHRWYHIRCVGIDASSIPVSWTCPECPPHRPPVSA